VDAERLIILYGSLRVGQPSFEALNLGAKLVPLGRVKFPGRLFDPGDYPGVTLGGARLIVGDLCRLRDPSVLAELDAFEQYRPDDPRPLHKGHGTGSLYIRRLTPFVDARGDAGEAYVYEYNGEWVGDGLRAVPEVGATDWIEYLQSRA
jgi:gamma-glutamylcyclotransferase (GGCT)/AIG2-like uncharacterized protein YtfP